MKRADRASLWQERVDTWKRSGLTIKQYCEDKRISKTMFYKWRGRLGAAERMPARPMEFVEITGAAEHLAIELVTAGGVVRLHPGFDEATLERLLNVLDKRR